MDDSAPGLHSSFAPHRWRGSTAARLASVIAMVQVRNGRGGMPRFREQKLSDAEVEAVANFVIAKAKANKW